MYSHINKMMPTELESKNLNSITDKLRSFDQPIVQITELNCMSTED